MQCRFSIATWVSSCEKSIELQLSRKEPELPSADISMAIRHPS
jgi:hypothetical protein